MYFQGLILIFFSSCMESAEVKLWMIYRNRILGSILVKHHKTNLSTIKEYGLFVFTAISCTETQQMVVNPFSSQKKYWEGIKRNCVWAKILHSSMTQK